MSENPYSYGQYFGQPPYPSFSQPTASPNPPLHYQSNPQQTGVASNNLATVNSSYEYNANSIPGLSLGSSSLSSISYPAQNQTSWPPQPQAAGHRTFSTQAQEQIQRREPAAIPQKQAQPALEEGELSEGEFEDLYEPKDTLEPSGVAITSPRDPSGIESRHDSIGDADGSSIYDAGTPQVEGISNSASTSLPAAEQEYNPDEDWEPSYPERERSGSYSPYLSPREIQRKVSVTKVARETQQIPAIPNPSRSILETDTSSTQQLVTDTSLQNGKSYQGTGIGDPAVVTSVLKDPTVHLPYRSVSEAKKKAQEAILGLWPLKVRYQDYIDEGFDEKLIKALFSELGLDASRPKPIGPQKASSDSQIPPVSTAAPTTAPDSKGTKDQPPALSKPAQPSPNETAPKNDAKNETKSSAKSAAEERKDKIARKLAAKAQKTSEKTTEKTTAVVQPAAPVQPSAPAQPTVPADPSQSKPATVNTSISAIGSPAKSKTRAENNAILYQKLAALKKAQERAEAEKKRISQNGARPKTSSVEPTTDTATLPIEPREELSTRPATVTLPTLQTNLRPGVTDQNTSAEGSIPGLSLPSSQSAQTPNRHLKRPVASDFDNYNPEGTLKRSRTQETLIIDVSDDEDVEMEIGSPTDEPVSSSELAKPPTRQTPLGSFPPLSDPTSWKQRSSPASSTAQTPPVSGAKLSLLQKRIQEAKQKIAEAEAKKATKQPDVISPPQVQTPPAVEPTRLLKVSEARRENEKVNVERRNRIASHELPTVEASLKEKQDILKQALAQAAQLELEIQAILEERGRLSAEIQQLAGSPEAPSTETNGQSPPINSADDTTTLKLVVGLQPSGEPQIVSDQDSDVPMTNGDEDTPGESPKVASIEDQPSLDSSCSQHYAPNEDPAASIQSLEDLHPANKNLLGGSNAETVPVELPTGGIEAAHNAPPSLPSIHTEEPDSTEQDTSMQTSTGESSPSDGDAYEPHPVPVSDVDDIRISGPENGVSTSRSSHYRSISPAGEQSVEQERIETHATPSVEEVVRPALENPSGEVQSRSSHEHPLLTSLQDGREESLPLDDLLTYHSPLGYFRAYRFHPKYFDDVAGGLKSMTYSFKIDPMRPVCPHALAGQQCPEGDACEFQHFETMVLPDAEIITQLGSSDMFTGETKTKFIEGLKKVLNELKANKVKDFDRITKAIVKHRQEFLDDKSKVLYLDAGS
ncbi:hypothetical protein F5B20DRAFT_541056 [Whalleya microplaca]|nr:hypothetical protein F5B20DRAFT_541056 [Whalleya microplaca]